ncbi:lipopolysaccharide export system protein LptA [Sphingomonas kyeonggiensis]|uniref:LptA/OstA family protein n=1 Tax=Sphingomonas kyeonggiensis TaxID=1268553 RepID=UPI00277FCF6E|nr:LptA/OstA family protein [Sphingomonas kyeonggiensis]MDQ0248950.1 lipopolysaccharide export system protein LptA [Sphingomonas kyeonggiensis]
MIRATALLPIGFTLALLAASPAAAQQRHDSNAPIDFDAQHIELQDKNNRVILSGGVRIKQAEMTLTGARVTLAYTGQITDGSPEVSRLDAAGGVTVTRPDQSASGQYAVYDVNKRIITMVGGVTLKQGPNIVSGGRLVINLDTGRATIDGSGVGGSTAAPGTPGVQSRGGRVTGRFSVPKRANAPATAPAPSATPAPKQ